MDPREIRDGVYYLGVIDWDRRLFDALIPLPEGTTYNSYLVVGSESTALFDTVDPTKTHLLLEALTGVERIDYVVSQHAEQDHSGSLAAVIERYPQAKLLCSPKAVELLALHLHLPAESLRAVGDGEELSLGGKTLRFLHTPWVHWPETMSTYIPEDKILLSCDLFGSHLASSDLLGRPEELIPAAKRYYAEIMMPLRNAVNKNLEKLAPLDIELILPSHGPAYGEPALIMDAYREWAAGPPHNSVVLPYVTMHGSTQVMVERLSAALIERGVKVERFDLASVDLGNLATALVDAATIVAGTPTVLTNPHPAMMSALYLVGALRPKAPFVSAIGSYGWAGKAQETIVSLLSGLKAEIIEPVFVRGLPTDDDLAALDRLAGTIAAKHAEAGL